MITLQVSARRPFVIADATTDNVEVLLGTTKFSRAFVAVLRSDSSGNTVTVKNPGGSTVTTLAANESVVVAPDSADVWKVVADLGGGSSDTFDVIHLKEFFGVGPDRLILASGEALTSDFQLAIIVGNANRTLTFTGDATIGGTHSGNSSGTNTGDQDLSGLVPLSRIDTDGTLAANSDLKIATQKAVKTYADALIAANDAMVFKGAVDCSTNPNYPAADRGHTYRVSVAGKIGGASGLNVEVGDMFICLTDGTAAGNQATVGANWSILQTNLDGAVIGPSIAVNNRVVFFDGVSGKLIKDSGLTLSGSNTGDQTAFVAAGGSHATGIVPDPGATAFTNNPRILGSQAAFVKHSGKVIGTSRVPTQQSTASATPVDLTTVQSITFTLDESTTLLITGSCWVVNTNAAGNSSGLYVDVNGTDTQIGVATAASTSSAETMYGEHEVTLVAGTHTIKLQFTSATAGSSFFADRLLKVYIKG